MTTTSAIIDPFTWTAVVSDREVFAISTNADIFEIEVHLITEARRQRVTNNF